MKEYPSHDMNELGELLKQYNNLRSGKNYIYLEEDSFEKIIDHYDEKDDLNKALEAADTALEYFPFSAQLLIKKADLLIALTHYSEALQFLQQASLFDNTDINIFILKTDALLALDMQPQAVELLEEALRQFEGQDKIELLFELADVYDDYEEFDKVFDCLKIILELSPRNEEALYKICFWTDFTGRNEESIRIHHKIIDEHPYNELAWFNLGAAYQGLKLFEKAIDAYHYVVIIDEKFDYAYRNMGDAFIRLRKYKDAIDVLEKVLELTRPEEVIYEAIGHCYFRMNKYAPARFNFRKASHMNPSDSKLIYKIALTYIKEKQWETAINHLENAMRINRSMPDYKLALGQCYFETGRLKDAIQAFSLVVHSRPKNVTAWESLVTTLFKAGYHEEAKQQCLSALKATDGKPIFHYIFSAILLTAGKKKEGLLQLQFALNTAPRMVKKFIQLNPSLLQSKQVNDLIATSKKSKKKNNQ